MAPIPVQNLYHMLAYAWQGLDTFDFREVHTTEHQYAASALGGLLVQVMQRAVRQGLDRDYRSHGVDTRQPRGRVDVSETARRMLRQSGYVHCQIDERVVDMPAHRAIKAALRSITHTEHIEAHVRDDSSDLLRHFGEVAAMPFTRGLVARATEHGQHRRLRLALQLCSLLAELLLPKPGEDGVFVLDVRREEKFLRTLFEAFVGRFAGLHRRRGVRIGRHPMVWHGLSGPDTGHVPTLVPDVVLQTANRWLVIECKFTPSVLTERAPPRFQSDHVRQLMAYVHNLQLEHPADDVAGLLLYARGETDVDENFGLWGNRIRVGTVHMDVAWPTVESRLSDLIGDEWLRAGPVAELVSTPLYL